MKKKVTSRDLDDLERDGAKVARPAKKKAEKETEPALPPVPPPPPSTVSAEAIAEIVAREVAKIRIPSPKVEVASPMTAPIKRIVITDIGRNPGGYITDMTMNVEREEVH